MREGINFGRLRTNSQCKIPKKNHNKPTLSRKINVKRLKNSQETVTGKNSKEKKTRDFSSIELIQVQVFTILIFNEKVKGLQGVKLIFFSNSHLAPKFFKVVANAKKVGRHF